MGQPARTVRLTALTYSVLVCFNLVIHIGLDYEKHRFPSCMCYCACQPMTTTTTNRLLHDEHDGSDNEQE
jgi:hypothetical protein